MLTHRRSRVSEVQQRRPPVVWHEIAEQRDYDPTSLYLGQATRSHRDRRQPVKQSGARVEGLDEALAASDALEIARLVGALCDEMCEV